MTKSEQFDFFHTMLQYIEDQAYDGCEIAKELSERYYK